MVERQIDYQETAPEAPHALQQLGSVSGEPGLDDVLVEFVRLRASQLNGCAYCVDLHTRKAKRLDVEERRLAAVAAWRESPFFSDRERAALALTEALTRMADQPVPDTIVETAIEQFTESEFVALVLKITAINAWNRLWVSFHRPVIPDL